MNTSQILNYNIEDGEHKNEVIVSWIITHSCQERCGYCISPKKIEELFSKYDHLLIQDKMIKSGVTKIRYIGGEPLLVPHIAELIIEAHNQGINTRLSTNGILLSQELFDTIKNSLNSIAFPFESLDDALNKSIRCSNCHRKIISEKIQMAKSVEHMGVLINTCVHKENINRLYDLGNFLYEKKIDHWKLRKFSSASGRGAVPNKSRFEISDDEFISVVNSLKKIYPNFQIDGRFPKKLATRLMISPQGYLYRMVDSKNIIYGNVLYDNLNIAEIYERDHCN